MRDILSNDRKAWMSQKGTFTVLCNLRLLRGNFSLWVSSSTKKTYIVCHTKVCSSTKMIAPMNVDVDVGLECLWYVWSRFGLGSQFFALVIYIFCFSFL